MVRIISLSIRNHNGFVFRSWETTTVCAKFLVVYNVMTDFLAFLDCFLGTKMSVSSLSRTKMSSNFFSTSSKSAVFAAFLKLSYTLV